LTLAGDLKTAKDAFDPLKEEWDTAETKRVGEEAADYKKQKDADREAAKGDFDALKEEYDAIKAETD